MSEEKYKKEIDKQHEKLNEMKAELKLRMDGLKAQVMELYSEEL